LLLLVLAFGLRWAASGGRGIDREVWPDGLDYSAVAANLVAGKGLWFPIEGELLPPPRPPGASLALAPATLLFGARGAWLASAAWGALAVLATALAARRVLPSVGALLAASIVLTAPSSVLSGGIPMSEACGQALAAVSLWSALALGGGQRPWLWAALGGTAVAWAVCIRLPLLALALPVAVAALRWRPSPATRASGRSPSLALAAGLPLLGLLGLLVWQRATYGSPWLNGYPLWVPELYHHHPELVMSLRWLGKPYPGFWEQGHLPEYALGLLGLEAGPSGQRLWSLPAALLALLGILRLASRGTPGQAALGSAVLAALALLGFHLLYAWQDLRFFEPLLPLLAVLAGLGAEGLLAWLQRLRASRILAAGSWVVLFVGCLSGPALALRARLDVARQEPSLCRDLDRLAPLCPPESLLLVNFPLQLAREVFGSEREIWLLDLGNADPLAARAVTLSIRGRRGDVPQVEVLSGYSGPDASAHQRLEQAWSEGRAVFVLRSTKGGPAGPAFEQLLANGARLESIERGGLVELLRFSAPPP
jgi:hypothetical protein